MIERRQRAIAQAVKTFGLRVVCLVCGHEQRFYPGHRRLRESACEVSLCGEKALRSRYWIARHPELALEAQRRARAVASIHRLSRR